MSHKYNVGVREIDLDSKNTTLDPDLVYLKNHIKYKLVNRITHKEGAVCDKYYHSAHRIATKEEKKYFPNSFDALTEFLRKHENEWLGDNFPDGTLIVSSIVPKELRNEVAFHEFIERRELDKMDVK